MKELKQLGTTRISFELGKINANENFIGLLCDTQRYFDKDTGEWVLTGDGATGRGESLDLAALLWIADRLNIQLTNGTAKPQSDDPTPLPEPDMQADPCSDDGTQTDYYTAGTVRRLLAAENERCAKLCEAVHANTGECPELALYCAERIRGPNPI